jgi:hypothetical protein
MIHDVDRPFFKKIYTKNASSSRLRRLAALYVEQAQSEKNRRVLYRLLGS